MLLTCRPSLYAGVNGASLSIGSMRACNAPLVFSAHGVLKTIRKEADERGFRIFDATCLLVKKSKWK